MRIFSVAILVAGLLAVAAPNGLGAATSFAGWPESWIAAYQRFESYNASREKHDLASDLEISPEGKVSMAPQFRDEERGKHIGLATFESGDGSRASGMASRGFLFAEERDRFYPPGKYAAIVYVTGLSGYQHLFPMRWFEIQTRPGGNRRQPPLVVIPRDPPKDPDAVWPNERLFKFLDFHVFPKNHPDDILEKNDKVSPNVTLRLTNTGEIQRDALDSKLEHLLRWRIYYNGNLVEKGNAGDTLSYKAARGPGTYQAWLGVEGPDGFFPVSNLLEFPLFPDESRGLVVFPSVANPPGLPDFLKDVLPPDQLNSLLSRPPSDSRESRYDKRSIYIFERVEPYPEKASLFNLWGKWAWRLNNDFKNRNSALGKISGIEPEAELKKP